ncbi:MAG: MarR family transcriptional regulator [Deltaproteobacteria bacterium]|nr:MarR family transcriptional regulator [Deltaproteobacteria bacterium]MBW1870523.1 MarR family transcriptional regulator [Deltaproteobacteria bacterium]
MVNLTEIKECPYYLITRASLVITAHLKRELASAGVGMARPAYLGVLMSLWHEDGLKTVDLGRRAGLEPSSMTGLLDRMERDCLVTRQADPDDRRAHLIYLTQQGQQVKEPSLAVVDRTLNFIFEGVSDEDQERIKKILRHMLANTHRQDKP